MLSEEAKARQKEAKRRWYEKNKDTYKHPDPEKHKESVRKASLAYYHRNKEEISKKEKKRIVKEKVDKRVDLLKRMNDLIKQEQEDLIKSNMDFPIFKSNVTRKPLAALF
jgi:hypothetical protein